MTPVERRMFSLDNAKTYHWAINGGAAKFIAEHCPEMLPKKPSQKGENHHNAKLKISDVQEIRSLSEKVSRKELKKRFLISGSALSNIITGKRWASVK